MTRLEHIRIARVCGADQAAERYEAMTDAEYEEFTDALAEKTLQHASDHRTEKENPHYGLYP